MNILIPVVDCPASSCHRFNGTLLRVRTVMSTRFGASKCADRAVRPRGGFFGPARGTRLLDPRAAVCFFLFLGLATAAFGQNPIQVHTQPANGIRTTRALLNGMTVPGSHSATVWFEWGTSRSYGNSAGLTNLPTGNQVIVVRHTLKDLSPNYVYHCRLVASNALGVVYGADQQFTLGASVIVWGNPNFDHTIVPDDLTNAVAIGGGADHCAALRNDGTVTAWGGNYYGQRDVPIDLGGAIAVSLGEYHSLVLLSDGTVRAWGAGTTFDPNPDSSNMEGGQSIVPEGLADVVQIAAGVDHSLALKSDGTVAAWGAARLWINAWDPLDQSMVPAGLSNVVAVAGGSFHSMALKIDGTVVTWGYNTHGQGESPPGLSNVVSIAAGWYHNFALKRDGTIVAWGLGEVDGGFPYFGQAIVPSGLSNVAGMAGGGFYSLAFRTDGSAIGWGRDDYGQVSGANAPADVVAVSGGYDFGLALKSSAPLEVALTLKPLGDQLQLVWAGGVLQSASEVDGTYTDMTIAVSPLVVTPSEFRRFYRVRVQP